MVEAVAVKSGDARNLLLWLLLRLLPLLQLLLLLLRLQLLPHLLLLLQLLQLPLQSPADPRPPANSFIAAWPHHH